VRHPHSNARHQRPQQRVPRKSRRRKLTKWWHSLKRADRIALVSTLAGILALPPAWIALDGDDPILRISAPWDGSPDPDRATTTSRRPPAVPSSTKRPRVPPTNTQPTTSPPDANYIPPAVPTTTTKSKPKPPTPPRPGPPTDQVMHAVWRGGAEAHAHSVGHLGWARTEFRMREPYLRSVEANIAGPTKVSFYVERHPTPDQWIRITQAIDVRVE
jgi:hypothetical protein